MSLTPEQKKWLYITTSDSFWLNELTSNDAFDPQELKDSEQLFLDQQEQSKAKQKILSYVRNTLLSIQKEIKEAFDTEVEFLRQKQIQGIEKSNVALFNDNNMGFDFMEDINDLPEAFFQGALKKQWDQAGIKITMLELEMKKDNLFTEDEIAKELFTPLVQQQILPETFVPNAYSAVQKMIDETNELYVQQLSKASSDDRYIADIAKDTINISASIVNASLGFSEVAHEISKEEATLGKGITDIISITSTTTIDTVEALYHGGDIPSACQIILKNLSSAVSNAIILSMGKGNDEGKGAKQIATFVALSMQSAAVGIKITASNNPKKELVSALQTILTTACDFGITAGDDDTKNTLGLIKIAIKKIFASKSYIDNIKKEVEKMNPQHLDFKKITVLCIQGAMDGLEQALDLKKIVEEQQKRALKIEAERSLENLGEGDVKRKEELEKLIATLKQKDAPTTLEKIIQLAKKCKIDGAKLTELIPSSVFTDLSSNIKKGEEDIVGTLKEEMNRILEEEKTELHDQLALLQSIDETTPSDAELQKIEQLLSKIQHDRAIWNKVFTLTEKGAKIAKKVLAALGPGVVMVQLIKSVSEAVLRAREVLTWKDNLDEAQSVSNPYLTSIQGMLRQQTEHLTQDSIRSALLVVQLAGEITALTPASAVGKLISAGAGLAMNVEEFLYRNYQRAQLKKAWTQTKIALKHPEYRRQNLYVRKLNPTLAKYTIGFGAVVAKDPIAISTMNKIGVTTDMLENPSAGVEKVKNFLSVLYNKDMEVAQQFFADDDWVHSLPAARLETTHWFMVSTKAKEMHVGCSFDDSAIISALKDLEESKARFIDTPEFEEVQHFCSSLCTLQSVFASFSATDAHGAILETMNTIKEEFLGLIEAEKDNITAVHNAIEKRLAQLIDV